MFSLIAAWDIIESMKTTRQRILEYLGNKPGASALEISRALSLTPANIRHHLRILLGEGAIEISAERVSGERGRPTLLYCLAQHARAHNLGGLASALLGVLLQAGNEEGRLRTLDEVAQRMVGQSELGAAHLTSRLNACIRRLDELSYRARWEAHAHGPRLILGHCPYAAILADHPELCQIDALLLQRLLGVPVAQVAKLVPHPQGGQVCIFHIRAQ